MKRIGLALALFATLIALVAPAWAVTYAIPNGNDGYIYLDQNSPQTFSIGTLSFPGGWLANATPAQLAANGIVAVVDPGPPTGNVITVGSSIQVVDGVPTVVYSTTPIPPPPTVTPAQAASNQYQAVLAAGVAITSTSMPALNGTYALDPITTSNIQAQIISILLNSAFTNGQTIMGWPDTSGALHTFTITQFRSFATALGQYVTSLVTIEQILAAGGTASWPPATATIP